jgi:putative PIN family toxin of toxin-antitoxin system
VIVLDTNVLVSGLLRHQGPPGRIVRMVAAGAIRLAHDRRILDEYREVLARPRLGIRAGEARAILEVIERDGFQAAPAPLVIRLPDPDDLVFIEVAASVQAQALVTGNLSHFPPDACRRHGVTVLSPAAYLDRIADEERRR